MAPFYQTYYCAATLVHHGQVITLMAYAPPDLMWPYRGPVQEIFIGLTLSAPQLYGIARDQALVLLGGETDNPRNEDPATSRGNPLVFRGLVTLNPQLQVVPDLAGG